MARIARYSAGVIACAVLVACGKTTGDTSGYGTGNGGRGSGGLDGGSSNGAVAATAGTMGSSQGQGGGSAVSGGGGASTGLAGNGPGGTGALSGAGATVGSGGAASQVDPYADARRQAAADYCGLLSTYPCLTYTYAPGTPDEQIQTCQQDIEIAQSTFGDVCFSEWQSLIECLVSAPWTCPCSDDCFLPPLGGSPGPLGGVCDPDADTLTACQSATQISGTVTGDAGDCDYFQNQQEGCAIQCQHGDLYLSGDCSGSVNGAQGCGCVLNGVPLPDPRSVRGWITADDCAGAAQQMADGYCERILDCCFTWTKDGTSQCTCTSDPTAAGFDSCQAAATAGGGEVVDLCPQYDIAWQGFPPVVDGGGG